MEKKLLQRLPSLLALPLSPSQLLLLVWCCSKRQQKAARYINDNGNNLKKKQWQRCW